MTKNVFYLLLLLSTTLYGQTTYNINYPEDLVLLKKYVNQSKKIKK